MRYFLGMMFAGLAVLNLSAGTAGASDVEVKGPHICCGMCVKVVKGILGKVDGASEVKADKDTKTVTFKATDAAAANAGVKALFAGGFFGAATADGKDLKVDVPAGKKGGKADKITVTGVHACCPMCHKAINGLFSDSKVTISGTGAQRTVVIEGTGLEQSAILEALRKSGFNGTIKSK